MTQPVAAVRNSTLPHAATRPSSRVSRFPVGGALSVLLLAWPAAAGAGQLAFTDVTGAAGIDTVGTLVESLAWGDYDNDGDPDLYLTANGANRLLRNDTMAGVAAFTDVTDAAGVGDADFHAGTAWGDLDNDGDLDLYAVTFQGGRDLLYRNDGPVGPDGAWVFTDIAVAAGLDTTDSARPVTLLDYDRDGLLDIFIMSLSTGANILYRNLGGLSFEDVSAELGIDDSTTGVGAVATDVDDDGWVDVFTGNRSGDDNILYRNSGAAFESLLPGGAMHQRGFGMGVLGFDYDNDLDIDLYWTTWPVTNPDPDPRPNALYENVGGNAFINVAAASGTEDALGWGVSANAADVDLDGWVDFFVTNGASPLSTPSVLFHNNGDRTFSDAGTVLGDLAFDARGVAFADYDGDGDLDLAVTANANAPAGTRLWRNDTVTDNHWLGLRLTGSHSNRAAIGARVEVTTDTRTTVGEVSGGAGRGSQNDQALRFGLGGDDVVRAVRIRWPSGQVQTLGEVAADQVLDITEPGQPMAAPAASLLRIRRPLDAARRALVMLAPADASMAGIGPDTSADPRLAGARVTVSIDGEVAWEQNLAAARWRRRSAGGWRYIDRRRIDGAIRRLRVAADVGVRLGARGSMLDIALDTDPDPVSVHILLGTQHYCFDFGGMTHWRPLRRFRAMDAPPSVCR